MPQLARVAPRGPKKTDLNCVFAAAHAKKKQFHGGGAHIKQNRKTR